MTTVHSIGIKELRPIAKDWLADGGEIKAGRNNHNKWYCECGHMVTVTSSTKARPVGRIVKETSKIIARHQAVCQTRSAA